ncbi:MAG: enoyl-CoA hydratase/isomerase family protein [Oscillospiraceae bacterium]|nr:enoyl-CoA hydratase/isomerase family protein [Oscillospiraceae bacterium]
MYEFFKLTQDGRVATITLDRPDCLNAVSTEVAIEIMDAIRALDADDSVGAIVITGAGKHFCAGGDIRLMKKYCDERVYLNASRLAPLQQMVKALRYCSKPVISMINHVATGAGCCIAMASDFRVMSPSSKVGMAFINLGIPGDTGGIFLMLRLLGPTVTNRMIMTGDLMGGEEAYRVGFASYLAEEGKLAEETYALAHRLAAKSATGIKCQKAVVNKYMYGPEMDEFFKDELHGMEWASRQPDFTEAVNAFMEKRPAEFNKGWPEGFEAPECGEY